MPSNVQRENHASLKRKRRLYDQLIKTNKELAALGTSLGATQKANRERLADRRVKLADDLGIGLHAAMAITVNPIPRPGEQTSSAEDGLTAPA